MKIKYKDGSLHEVFGILWQDYKARCLVFVNGGDVDFPLLEDVDVVDCDINFRTAYDDMSVYHWALVEENLFMPIMENDIQARIRFLQIVKSEGLLPYDFT